MKDLKINNIKEYLLFQTESLSIITDELRLENLKVERSINQQILDNLLCVSLKTNFDESELLNNIYRTIDIKQDLEKKLQSHALNEDAFNNNKELGKILNFERYDENEDIKSLKKLILKANIGIASFIKNSNAQGFDDEEISSFMQYSLSKLLDREIKIDELFAIAMKIGEFGIRAMQLLDYANTKSFGEVKETSVNMSTESGKAILVAGDSLVDLKELLEQVSDKDIALYTYGELLSANTYEEFKKYDSLKGHYNPEFKTQKEDFSAFKGNILVTSAPFEEQDKETMSRIYTTGSVKHSDAEYISGSIGRIKDFSDIIETAGNIDREEKRKIITGFSHHELFEHIDEIISGLNTKAIRKIYLVIGNNEENTDYYNEIIDKTPDDVIVITAGNVKFSILQREEKYVNGLMKVLDAGQMSDSYSVIYLLMKLATTMGLNDVNDLPVVYNIAWNDEKSITVFLSLIALGMKNIVFSPSLPEFLTENVAKILSEQFRIKSISTVKEDFEKYILKESSDIMDIPMGELVLKYPQLVNVLMDMGMHCIGCPSSHMETIEEAALVHGLDVKEVERILRENL